MLFFLLLSACASQPKLPPTSTAELLNQDRAFSETSRAIGFAEAMRRFLVEDAIQLPQDAAPVFGREHIAQGLENTSRTFVVTWEPESGAVAESGDIGWTWGRYLAVRKDSGEPIGRGKYLNIWERQPDGSWRVKVDVGNQTPMPH